MKAIAAISINGIIGRNNELPWNLPIDLKRFKDLTGKDRIVMGRRTFDSLPKVLPNRDHIILTRTPPEEKSIRTSKGNLIEYATHDEINQQDLSQSWLIGGQQVYALLAKKVTELYVTLILNPFEGDAWFPWGCYANFELRGRSPVRTAKNGIDYCFLHFKLKEKK